MIDHAEVIAVRRRLRRAWAPFFTRYGRLTPIQAEAIPRILNGANVVLVSSTASGKTEAVIAPVAERFVAEHWDGLCVLYVVPTRALANEALARIEGPLGDMRISAALKHGDRPYLPKRLPGLLITTPESLDSLICRYPDVFDKLRTVILDEIHLLDNTYRGDQLRILLPRLKGLTSIDSLSVHLLSATLSQPLEIAQRYTTKPEIVVVRGRRQIDSHILGPTLRCIGWPESGDGESSCASATCASPSRRWRMSLPGCGIPIPSLHTTAALAVVCEKKPRRS